MMVQLMLLIQTDMEESLVSFSGRGALFRLYFIYLSGNLSRDWKNKRLSWKLFIIKDWSAVVLPVDNYSDNAILIRKWIFLVPVPVELILPKLDF